MLKKGISTIKLLDVFTDARLGELMGLEWDNIDMDNNIVEIAKASQHTVEKGTFDKKPKNESSIRKISIPEPVKQILREYRVWWLKQKVLAGEDWEDTNKLFATQYGRPMFPYALSGWLPKFLEEHNLPKITPHGLRHTMATVLASQGLPVTAISHRLGHARTSTTMDIYVHALQSADTAASDYLQEALL